MKRRIYVAWEMRNLYIPFAKVNHIVYCEDGEFKAFYMEMGILNLLKLKKYAKNLYKGYSMMYVNNTQYSVLTEIKSLMNNAYSVAKCHGYAI